MFFIEVIPYDVGLLLATSQIAAHVPHQFGLIAGATTANRVALDVLIEDLVRIQFRTVTGQKEKADAMFLGGKPCLEFTRAMNGMTVEDQKHPVRGLPSQTLEERLEHGDAESFLEDHEAQLAAVGNGRDHIASKPLTRPWHHGRVTLTTE